MRSPPHPISEHSLTAERTFNCGKDPAEFSARKTWPNTTTTVSKKSETVQVLRSKYENTRGAVSIDTGFSQHKHVTPYDLQLPVWHPSLACKAAMEPLHFSIEYGACPNHMQMITEALEWEEV
ncbi:protein of unknown function [Nitrospira japonica]|uniref:Uncharacterized protein n=1 Tax=Nitrospira japonica TaxID=1325564 RepID=A0A1W1I4Z8_9BACT|nr:protein of unknown function [Nitrospira japonica]